MRLVLLQNMQSFQSQSMQKIHYVFQANRAHDWMPIFRQNSFIASSKIRIFMLFLKMQLTSPKLSYVIII